MKIVDEVNVVIEGMKRETYELEVRLTNHQEFGGRIEGFSSQPSYLGSRKSK